MEVGRRTAKTTLHGRRLCVKILAKLSRIRRYELDSTTPASTSCRTAAAGEDGSIRTAV